MHRPDRGERLFRALTRRVIGLAPPMFRERHGLEIEATAADQRAAGGLGVALRELLDLVRMVIQLRRGAQTAITSRTAIAHTPWSPMHLRADFGAAVLRLTRQPRRAAPIVLLLAVAIGLASSMFGVVDAFLLRPAPFSDPATLHKLGVVVRGGQQPATPAVASALRANGPFADVRPVVLNASGDVETRRGTAMRRGSRVTPGTFAMLGVRPLLGREFVPGEGAPGNDTLVLLSEQVWRSDFDADPLIVGSAIRISGVVHTVVGVMPGSLRFPVRGEGTWRPFDPDRLTAEAAESQMLLYVRRDAAMSEAEAEQRAATVLRQTFNTEASVDLGDSSSGMLDTYSRESLVTLAIGVALLFVLLCTNVSTLVLAHTMARQHEFGICSALGASRARLITQSCLESLLTGTVASALGVALAAGLVRVANVWMPDDLAWRTLNPLDLDLRIVAAAAVLGLLATMVSGLPAAWLGTRQDVSRSLRLATRTGSVGHAARRLSRVMLAGEPALAVALLAAAGLQLRSFVNLVNADRGLDTQGVLTASVELPAALVADPATRPTLVDAVESRAAALPGVVSTTVASGLPPEGGSILFEFEIRADAASAVPTVIPFMFGYRVAPGFFSTLGIGIEQGREFTVDDGADSVVLSRALAGQVFGSAPAVGRAIVIGSNTYRVVGVATEIRNSLSDPRSDYPEFYRVQHRMAPGTSRTLALAIQGGPSCPSHASVQQAITAVIPTATRVTIAPLSDAFMTQLARPQTATVVATAFACLALAAVAVGLFGVLASAVARRKHEFGIRVALGADPHRLRTTVLSEAMRTTVVGVGIGVGVGWVLGRWLESVQFGVTFFDPLTWAVVVIVVTLAALVAAWVPARRAMRADPVALLRD